MIPPPPVPALIAQPTGEASCWRQHCTKDGRVFWNNTLTGKSTWDKPDDLKTDVELAMAQMPWKEYTTSDGRTYWSNKYTKQSVWKCPEEVEQLKNELNCVWEPFTDKQVAKSRLRTLFRIKNITSKTRLSDAMANLQSDPRYKNFAILTTGEKRQAFSEYQTQLKKIERERERFQKIEARKMYIEYLSKWEGLKITSYEAQFSKDYANEWWLVCLPVNEREELFDDHIEENEARFAQEYRNERSVKRSQVSEYLKQHPKLSLFSKWDDALDLIVDENLFLDVELRDIFIAWESMINGLHAREKRQQDEHVRRIHALRHQAFRNFIQKEIDGGVIHAKLSFRDFIIDRQECPEYSDVVGIPLATPREIYESCCQPLKTTYEKQKSLLKQVIKNVDLQITSSTTFVDFKRAIGEAHESCRSINDTNCMLFFKSLHRRATRKERTNEFSPTKPESDNGGEQNAKSICAQSLNEISKRRQSKRGRRSHSGEISQQKKRSVVSTST